MNRIDFVNKAKKYVGKPYVWGGESDAEGGFDCSGYVYNVLKDSGFPVGRLTAQGYYNKYKALEISSPIQGALLFFGKSKEAITHIAIADTDGYMYESIGNKSNTKYKPGKGVTRSKQTRRKDLVACVDLFKNQVEADSYYPRYTGASLKIDIVFAAIGAPYGNVKARKPVAKANGFSDYSGSLAQNLALIRLAKNGKLKR